MYYSHDTFGLGHLRRTLKIAGTLAQRWPACSQLIVTGSPVGHRFTLPDSADYIKLPSVVKVGVDSYESRALRLDFEDMIRLRSRILLESARRFAPDLLLVDHAPAGLRAEMLPTLRGLRLSRPRTRLVLGLRDIVDEPERVRRAWRRDGVYELLDDVYDAIFVYGERAVCDVAAAYGLSPRAAHKVHYVGYLGLPSAPSSAAVARMRAAYASDGKPFVLVTAGGGGDGNELLHAALETFARPALRDHRALLVSGPLIPAPRLAALRRAARAVPGVQLTDFVDDMPACMAAADAIITMGGYNSVCEALGSGQPLIIVPRTWPRREQWLRASALARRGLASMIEPERLCPVLLETEIRDAVDRSAAPGKPSGELPGLAAMAASVESVMLPQLSPALEALA